MTVYKYSCQPSKGIFRKQVIDVEMDRRYSSYYIGTDKNPTGTHHIRFTVDKLDVLSNNPNMPTYLTKERDAEVKEHYLKLMENRKNKLERDLKNYKEYIKFVKKSKF